MNFLIVAFVMFLTVRWFNRRRRQEPPPAPDQKNCPYCFSKISIKATWCAHGTSVLEPA